MGDQSAIEWTDATWNVTRGCRKVSAGCDNCYAIREAHRHDHPGGAYEGATAIVNGRVNWSGAAVFAQGKLAEPLHWTRPRRVFVNSMSDLFYEGFSDSQIDKVFAVMAAAPQHTFQVLTKRPERMLAYLLTQDRDEAIGWAAYLLYEAWSKAGEGAAGAIAPVQSLINSPGYRPPTGYAGVCPPRAGWPLPNVWLGVSVEHQAAADQRIPLLLQTPAAVWFLSCEPLLGSVDLRPGGWIPPIGGGPRVNLLRPWETPGPAIDWVIAGGESGPGARPMHPDWARSLRDQCQAAGVPFFFKQWGEWEPVCPVSDEDAVDTPDAWDGRDLIGLEHSGIVAQRIPARGTASGHQPAPDAWWMGRVGKKAAGRQLDGRTWDEMPAVVG